MKLFNIPEWDTSSGLTHYATTWILSRESDRTDVVDQLIETVNNKLSYDINIDVPIGEVYYLSALRFLKDADGNDIGYDKWIGPTKIIDDDSNMNDVLIPKTYVNTPYVTNLKIDAVSGLNISLAPYSGNVPHLSTRVVIESITGVELYTKDYASDVIDIVIPNTIHNFTVSDFVIVKIIYIGDLNTVSDVYKEKVSYSKSIYTIAGSLSVVDPSTNTDLYITPVNNTYVSITSAQVTTLDDLAVVECVKDNNKLIIMENSLDYRTTYKLVINVEYVDPVTSTTVESSDVYFISTRNEDEVPTFKQDVVYNNTLDLLHQDLSYNISNYSMMTEQSLYGVIPFMNSGKIMLFTHDENTNTYDIIKDTGIAIPNSYFKMEFLPNGKFIVFYNDGDSTACKLFNYDYYTDTMSLITTFTNMGMVNNIFANSFTLIGDRYYYYDYVDTTIDKVRINYIDLVNNTNNLYKDIELPDLTTFSYPVVQLIDTDKILIVPSQGDAVYSYIYDFTYDSVIKGPSIPVTWRRKWLVSKRLINGDILYNKYNADDNKEYMLYDSESQTMTTGTFDVTTDRYFRLSIKLKSGVYDELVLEGDSKYDLYRFS